MAIWTVPESAWGSWDGGNKAGSPLANAQRLAERDQASRATTFELTMIIHVGYGDWTDVVHHVLVEFGI
jgi:hypothetical protein